MSALKTGAAVAVGVVLGAAGLAAAQSAAQAVLPLPTQHYIGKKLGLIDVDPVAFPCMKGYQLGLSYTIALPGAGLAPHSHKAQWEVVQIVSGKLSVQRNGGPIEDHGPGDVILNDQSIGRHSVLNRGTEPVVFYTAALGKPGGPAPPTQ
jgi:quercetin dioxygenase-like cupin family protein